MVHWFIYVVVIKDLVFVFFCLYYFSMSVKFLVSKFVRIVDSTYGLDNVDSVFLSENVQLCRDSVF